jgi:hypothetical protein
VGGMDASADWPRLTVGRDGSVYIIYQTLYALCLGDGANTCGTTNSFCCSGSCQAGVCANRNPVNPQHQLRYALWVEKLSSCDDGFRPLRPTPPPGSPTGTFPILIKDPVVPISDMPGIDRQVIGNYMIAGDDVDTNNRRLFLTFIEEASSQNPNLVIDGVPALANDNVRVAESRDAGLTWTIASSPVNTTTVGHRYFPWICTTNGIAYVTWYDRRTATLANTGLTSYFHASVSDPMNNGALAFGAEVNVSGGPGFDDPQCRSGFPLGARSAVEETLCTDLPTGQVAAGLCLPSPSLALCDFRAGTSACSSPAVCSPGDGVPKYGDYNGAACAAGNLFMAWTTAVPPKGQACTPKGGSCATSGDCCSGAACVNGLCSDQGPITTCTANGGACTAANAGFCCSGNCLGGFCQPFVGVFASSTAVTPVLSCATTATANANFSAAFDVDTGLSGGVGANYGQDMCRDQYLVDVDLTASAFTGRNTLSVSGFWSSQVPAPGEPCNLGATMSTYVLDQNTWRPWDIVTYLGVVSGSVCFPQAQSHTDGGSVGLDVARIPLNRGFTRARIAVNAVAGGTTKKAVAVVGLVN